MAQTPTTHSSFDVQVDFVFTERVFTLTYYSLFDIISILGGFNASIAQVFSFISPFFILIFFIKLSHIIRSKMADKYWVEHKKLLSTSLESFESIIKFAEEVKFKFPDEGTEGLQSLKMEILSHQG